MSIWEVLLVAFSVSLDAFALSVAGALTSRQKTFRNALLAAGFFGGFQFFMPLLGYLAASLLHHWVEACDHWIAFALLAFVGGKMVCEGLRGEAKDGEKPRVSEFFDWKYMFIPAVATSIDALAVGAGIAFSGDPILVPAAAMGVVTGLVSAAGVCFGRQLGKLAGVRVLSCLGGAAIIVIGADILRRHLTGA